MIRSQIYTKIQVFPLYVPQMLFHFPSCLAEPHFHLDVTSPGPIPSLDDDVIFLICSSPRKDP